MEFYKINIRDYKQLIALIKANYKLDVSYYSKIVFRHRMTILMNYYKIKNLEALFTRLEKKQISTERLCYFLQIPITEMFRDPAFWRVFIKLLQKENSRMRKKRILFPGGMVGNNELFSLLILLKELHIEEEVKLTVTNPFPIKNDFLSGLLSRQEFELSKANFNRLELHTVNFDAYFEKDYIGNYKFKYINDCIKKVQNINFDFMTQAMQKKQDIIFFRNQLLYFSSPQNETILSHLSQTLNPNGWLFIGEQEQIKNPEQYNLALINASERMYRKSVE